MTMRVKFLTTPRGSKKKMQKSTRIRLQERQDTPLILTNSAESLNAMSLEANSNPVENSMPCFHGGSGYNLNEGSASMSGRIFVLSYKGEPLTPCKPQKARKLLDGGVAKPIWHKFGQFGIQILVETREFVPKTILGVDWGTKFEGCSIVSETDNNLNVMWKLPNKRIIANKLEERRQLRRARRWRNCRRRACKFDNRNRKGFIAPSQKVIVNSRLKAIKEILKCYSIKKVVIEDVKFNHRDKKWGKNFSTVEIGKQKIYDYIKKQLGKRGLKLVKGYDTFKLLEKYGLKKNKDKSEEDFYSHCIDSFVIASEQFKKEQKGFMQRIGNKINEDLIIVDDTSRPTRRRLHDTEPAKGGIRNKYSTGNFKGIRKGTMCESGQIVGGTKTNFWIRNMENKRIGRRNISWLSHQFKTKEAALLPNARQWGIRAEQR
ncbi:RRXRR domain-containing protein [archaeon]|nr:RRXRR domain-containing protein [archaeon]